MSSGSVVVIERLGQLGDAPHEMAAPGRIQLAEDVVEQEQRRPAVEIGQQVQLGQLERQDRGPLLAARGEGGQVAAVEAEDQVVAVRPDERGAVPDLLLGGLAQPPGQRVPRRLPGERRGVRRVADRQPLLGRGDLAMGRGERLGQQLQQPQPGGDDGRAGGEEGLVPEPQLVAVAPRPRGSRAAGCCAAGGPGRTWPWSAP